MQFSQFLNEFVKRDHDENTTVHFVDEKSKEKSEWVPAVIHITNRYVSVMAKKDIPEFNIKKDDVIKVKMQPGVTPSLYKLDNGLHLEFYKG